MKKKKEEIEEQEEGQKEEQEESGNYFLSEKRNLQFFSSGCVLLDCVLGGGWPLRRISNIVGDKSTGKTLLAIEACANFNKNWPDGKIKYHETESAFDEEYAEVLGFPVTVVEFIQDIDTVEGLFTSLEVLAEEQTQTDEPLLYIVDSLDALSDKTEMESNIESGTYGTGKAKMMSQLFRRLSNKVKKANMHIMFISQIRDKIGVRFGSKYTRSGGHGLDFYASQIIWLYEIGKIKHTIKKVERITGIDVDVKCKKNKVGPPFRTCEFPLLFYYGIDDVTASLNWLKEIKALGELEILDKDIPSVAVAIKSGDDPELKQVLDKTVIRLWNGIESSFMPKHKKY